MGRSQTHAWMLLPEVRVLQGQGAEVDEEQVLGDGVPGQGGEHRSDARQVQAHPELGREGAVIQQTAHRMHLPVGPGEAGEHLLRADIAGLQAEDGLGVGDRQALSVEDAVENGFVHGRAEPPWSF